MIPKFRAWDKEKKTMDIVDGITFDGDEIWEISFPGDCWRDASNYELMQSTGLTDKNGKEVYENDVVNIHWFYRGDGSECEAELNKVVIYHDSVDEFNAPYFFVMDKDEVVPLSAILMHEESIEVLGNVHEHPHLVNT